MEIDLTSVIWDRDGDLKLSREQGRDGNSVSSISISGGGGNTLPKHGSISVDPSTFLITYTPDEHFVGADTCTYTVCDELRNCTKGRLDIGVAPVNDAHTLRVSADNINACKQWNV